MGKIRDLTGNRFSRLLVLEKWGLLKGITAWLCKCDCGNTKIVCGQSLLRNNTKSCGCLRREMAPSKSVKHGMSYTRQYEVWDAIIQRCTNQNNPAYKYYGARGIKICDSWLKFENFWADMKNGYTDNLTIDRVDNNKGYYKENCHWTTMKEQNNNKRNCKILEYQGVKKNIKQWADKLEMKCGTLRNRINTYNWSLERALTTKPDLKFTHKARKE